MSKTILVCGFGPGISTAVAEKFGAEGFTVGLVARSAEKLAAGVKALEAKGVKARAFPTDLGDPAAVEALVQRAHDELGPITVIHWNAYASGAGDLLKADKQALDGVLDVALNGLLAAIRASLPDLRAHKEDAAVLITNGGLGYFDPQVDAMAVEWNAMGLAVANAAKHKLVGLLSHKLKSEGIYVGEVVVLSLVKGTAFDNGSATLDPAHIAGKFWGLYRARTDVSVNIG